MISLRPISYANILRSAIRFPGAASSRLASTKSSAPEGSELVLDNKKYETDEWTNVPPSIGELVGRNLHQQPKHPLGIIRNLIETRLGPLGFTPYSDFHPVVSKYANFDSLGFPEDHPGRSRTDTYYLNAKTLLRTHTSAHEIECFKKCTTPGYLISADVYRRDTVDRTHYPAFHQMEGAYSWNRDDYKDEAALVAAVENDLSNLPAVSVVVEDPNPPFHEGNPKQPSHSTELCTAMGKHLKRTMEIIMVELFTQAREAALAAGSQDEDLFKPLKARWIEAYFPWTSPSWEIEIWWKGEWLEMCGCGIVQQSVHDASDAPNRVGWAFGIGLERAAMILFGVPDIRLFWSKDPKFLAQFEENRVTTFKPWSKYPGTARDVAFWAPKDSNTMPHENDVMEILRTCGGDLVENVSLVDEFTHPKSGRKSQCYRINYQSMERNLTNEEINKIQDSVIKRLEREFNVEIR